MGLLTLALRQAQGARSLPEHLHVIDQSDFRSATLGLIIEVAELANEAQWKPWREYPPPDDAARMRVLDEVADVLHFLAWMLRNLSVRFDIPIQAFAGAFMEKHLENIRRFRGEVPGREPPGIDRMRPVVVVSSGGEDG